MIAAVIMAGGAGTRLFPASTMSRPKQFVRWPARDQRREINEETAPERSLLQETYLRVQPLADPGAVFIATTEALAGLVAEQLPDVAPENIIVEPIRRNSAAACALATARVAAALGPETTIMVVPSDATVNPDGMYQDTLRTAIAAARDRAGIVVVGIRPSRLATGYGYIRPGERLGPDTYRVEAFVEKPDEQRAKKLVDEGCLWNAGIFVWRADVAREAFESLLPTHGRLFTESADAVPAIFEEMPAISIDFGVAERWHTIFCVAGHFEWDDLGAWDAFSRVYSQDAESNVSLGQVRFVGSSNCVAVADEGEIVAFGVDDLVIVRFGGTVLVCPRDRAQDVGKLTQ